MTTEEYLVRMKKDEPYVSCVFDCPRDHQPKVRQMLWELDMLADSETDKRTKILEELFGTYTPAVSIGRGFKCDFGFNIHFHGFAIVNFNVTMLDTSPIHIGNGAFIAPGVVISCAGHSLIPEERAQGIVTSAPIFIEDGVWLGANVTVCPGVRIGAGSTIGAGSVVTRDIPAGVVAAGNPCRVLRKITDADRKLPVE